MAWLQVIAPPTLIIIGGIITWFIKSRVEELQAIEAKLQEDRRKIYLEILDPYIRIFADKGNNPQQAIKKISSYEYRKTAFELNLFGSDEVVKAYNELMQHFFKFENMEDRKPAEMFKLYGKFLLEIRKSLGNKKTVLNEIDMFSSMITDLSSVK